MRETVRSGNWSGNSVPWVRARLRAAAVIVTLLVMLTAAVSAVSAREPVNVNSASVEQLAALPGIGRSKAEAIVRERAKKPFAKVGDLERVNGIGSKTLAQLREHVVVAPDKAVE